MLIKTFTQIFKHPLTKNNRLVAFIRYFSWQIGYRLNPYPVIYPFVENSKLIIEKGMTGATGNIYTGLHDFEEMGFTIHLLRSEDFFADIGANIGSYTILASSLIGTETISFEPVPSTYRHLLDNININNIFDKVKIHNIGLGNNVGQLLFSSSLDTINHVVITQDPNLKTVIVPVDLFDNFCSEKIPLLIKIDVEGFEMQVLQGGSRTLANRNLKAIIIELNGSGVRYGISDVTIHKYLTDFGFNPFQYFPFERKLKELSTFKPNGNTIYIRDVDFVKQRVEGQRKIKVLEEYI